MNRFRMVTLLLVLAISIVGLSSVSSFAADPASQSVQGNVICLIPDYKKGTVTPVIATGPCNTLPPHQHVLMTKEGTVYSLQGLQDGLMKIALMPQKEDVTMAGKIEGNNYGWVLIVN